MTDTIGPPRGAAFLLAQVGAHAAMRFGQRMGEHGLTPPFAGVLGLVTARPGMRQQELAKMLGMLPSRMVALVDELEADGLVQRVRDDVDRRRYALEITTKGRTALQKIAKVAKAHEDAICAALTEKEKTTLTTLLGKIAAEQGLTSGVHPGYRKL
ncbi:MAG: hypothetical protein QOI15_1150 [Pseudonocardiales bacterium]|nr:hypothetical protein [Pseudonocardiales bacterium]